MPLDFVKDDEYLGVVGTVPKKLNFDVRFEPTKVMDKKYVINNTTD